MMGVQTPPGAYLWLMGSGRWRGWGQQWHREHPSQEGSKNVPCLGTWMMPTPVSRCRGVSVGGELPWALPALIWGADKGQSWVVQRAVGYLGKIPLIFTSKLGGGRGLETEARPSALRARVHTHGCMCVRVPTHGCQPAGSRGSIPLPWQPERVPRQQDGPGDSQEGQQSVSPPTPLYCLAPRDWRRKEFRAEALGVWGPTLTSILPAPYWCPECAGKLGGRGHMGVLHPL